MELLSPAAVITLLAIVAVAVLASLVLIAATVPAALRETRRDRQARHESIPAYYGRLHFA
ncbi:hypothetical protein [Nocardioides hwasunensis]|uniref:Type II secretion system protein n=1 Tax=Nocardioides hwasunensis TaxID=397258 RepID=A0ABR8MF16_9ACTN|nr:hypothetical protein [Nocardioides hwasunensis]MBD3913064.1 hypothetical protein [Nocardioides hwasunensis]